MSRILMANACSGKINRVRLMSGKVKACNEMERWERNGILLAQVSLLKEEGSWCGETHVQKASYFLEELTHVPLGFDFILYRHGPFSFELRDELTELRAVGFLELESRPLPYGPSFLVTSHGLKLVERHRQSVDRYRRQASFVASKVGEKAAAELERLATALYLKVRIGGEEVSEEARAAALREVKPHVSEEDALTAVKAVDEWMEEWARLAS